MASSFIIVTNIQVPKKIAKIFNEKFNPWKDYDIENIYEDIEKYDISLSSYFDNVLIHKYGTAGVKSLDLFLENGHNWSPCINHNNWVFNNNNILCDSYEKFYGAITVLDFFIERFFKNNFLLNGTIMAINTESPMAYVYNVKDNVITLDEAITRDILKELEVECNEESKHYRLDDYYNFNRQEFLNKHFNKYVNNNSYDIKLYNSKIDEQIDQKDEILLIRKDISLRKRDISLRKRELDLIERELNIKEKDLIRREKEMDEKEKNDMYC
jgi:hypothetical protein